MTFLGLTAGWWWIAVAVLVIAGPRLWWELWQPKWDPKRGFEPTSQFDFDDIPTRPEEWWEREDEDDPWDAVLFERTS